MRGGWVYIMTNKPGGVIYIGVCADIVARVAQHRDGKGSAFCKRYNLKRLVYVEPYPTIDEAIRREKAMKEWQRAWKVRRIEEMNPHWDDLWETILG
ncbi:MAG TPA: GIY-YIG nuclease family protein [Allosphingosinicella sp.]|jgi:putative endonuclease|nr:GIY-YIG nuclease family protein [Allosphingosinicella sp.]